VTGKPGQEGPSRLDMVKVWLLDPRSRLVVRRRLAGFRLTRRSVLAAGMAVWLLYAALVWQFGGRRLDDCTSLACRALLGGLPFGPGEASPPAAAAGSATPAPMTGSGGGAPATAPAASPAATTTTSGLPPALVPSTAGAPQATTGEPTSTTVPASTPPGSSASTTTAATSTTVPQPHCKPKKHRECSPKRPHLTGHWWRLWHVADLARGW
jgi:hypothetical protein